MKDKEITNVILVENHVLDHVSTHTSRQYIKDKEITNVIIVENPSLNQDMSRNIPIAFMKARKIMSVSSEFEKPHQKYS